MSERDAFLAAVIAAPDDDRPRLIFADWLDEHGDSARAEFIRLQIRIAQFVPPVRGEECTEVSASWCPNCGDCSCRDRAERMDDPGCPLHAPDRNHDVSLDDLRSRERELLSSVSHQLPGVTTCNWPEPPVFRRGFVEEITCPWNREHIAAIQKATPLRRVRLTTAPRLVLATGSPSPTFCLDGGKVRRYAGPEARVQTVADMRPWLTDELLAAEFPGVRFELPLDSP